MELLYWLFVRPFNKCVSFYLSLYLMYVCSQDRRKKKKKDGEKSLRSTFCRTLFIPFLSLMWTSAWRCVGSFWINVDLSSRPPTADVALFSRGRGRRAWGRPPRRQGALQAAGGAGRGPAGRKRPARRPDFLRSAAAAAPRLQFGGHTGGRCVRREGGGGLPRGPAPPGQGRRPGTAARPRGSRVGAEQLRSRVGLSAASPLPCLFFYFYFFRSLLPRLSCADASGLNAEPGLIASYPPGESWAGPLPGLPKRGDHLRQARLCVTPFIAVQYVFTCRWGREVLRRAVGVLQRAENVFLTVCIRSIQGVPSVFQMRW